MKSDQTIDSILQELCNIVYQHGKATRTNTPFHYGEPLKEAKTALEQLFEEEAQKEYLRGYDDAEARVKTELEIGDR